VNKCLNYLERKTYPKANQKVNTYLHHCIFVAGYVGLIIGILLFLEMERTLFKKEGVVVLFAKVHREHG